MSTFIPHVEACPAIANAAEHRKVRMILVDGSPNYMKVVLELLELHDRVDLIGRASNFEEAIQLVANHQPDMVLVDLDLKLANLMIPAVALSTQRSIKVLGLCADRTIATRHLDFLAMLSALVHRSCLQKEMLSAVDSLFSEFATRDANPPTQQ